jgi:pyruvate-formate lyase-activating enzyme
MLDFTVLEPAIDPNNRISFLIDWEVTKKCNLDCSYCPTGIDGGHDNSTRHPPLTDCLKSIDFMFEYADLYMRRKPKGIKYVILNVYGGEALHHPDIVEILQAVHEKYKPYAGRWHLTVTNTTNLIVTPEKLDRIIPYVDEFTVSYHAENLPKQKQQFKDNVLKLSALNKQQKCIVMMHPDTELFKESVEIIDWLKQNQIRHLPKPLDRSGDPKFFYKKDHVVWFNQLYNQTIAEDTEDIADTGRACCGGRSFCKDTNYKAKELFVTNKFTDWYCSVNHFFMFIRQVDGGVFVNKDCKMNYQGEVGPIGNLSTVDTILADLKGYVESNNFPIIQCKKYKCQCGLCAPKAQDLDTYKSIMKKYQKDQI